MENNIRPRGLGLDDVEANALFAHQHHLDYLFANDPNLRNAFISVREKQKERGIAEEELMAVTVDEEWVNHDLKRLAKAADKVMQRAAKQAHLWKNLLGR